MRHVDVCIDEHEQVPQSVARAGVARSPYVLNGLMDDGCSVGPGDIDGQIRAVIVYNYRFHFYASVCAQMGCRGAYRSQRGWEIGFFVEGRNDDRELRWSLEHRRCYRGGEVLSTGTARPLKVGGRRNLHR